jgi:MFS family permease
VHGVFLGLAGSSATFAPLVADTSLWWERRRGIAVAVCASGNYLAGAIWPPIVQHFVETAGWRHTYIGLGVFCALPCRRWRCCCGRGRRGERAGGRGEVPRRRAARPAGAPAAGRRPRRASTARAMRPSAVDERGAGAAVRRRRGVLRGDVDAAGAHRRLLRRPGLRRGARAPDAVADAGCGIAAA